MEFYANLFEPVLQHIQEYLTLYMIVAPIALIIVIFTRRYSVPLLLYAVEFAAYAFAMHTIVHVLVRLTAWFKNSSSMSMLQEDGLPVDAVFWTTPWLAFWDGETYDPGWIVYVEMVFLVAILGLMYRYRPMKIQQKRTSRYAAPPPPKPAAGSDSDDEWGVPKKRHFTPTQPLANSKGKKR